MLGAGGYGLLLATLVASAAHGAEVRIRLENTYDARIDLGPLGNGIRTGTDIVEGVLVEQADGTWVGTAEAHIVMSQELHGLGMTCPMTRFTGTQTVNVRADPESDWNSAQSITFDRTAGPGQHSGKYLGLSVDAAEDPAITPTGPCLTLYQRTDTSPKLLPLNDGRWTQPGHGYAIELPESGVLVWTDQTANTFDAAGEPTTWLPANGISNWKVRVERIE